jgi:hypothetical protein
MRRPKRLALILLTLVPLGIGLAVVSPAFADDSQLFQACQTLAKENKDNKDFKPSPICADKNTTANPVNHILHVAADIVALLTGLAAVILIIISGISMITSGGNTEAAANARKRITNAIIGLVIVAFAWTIVTFLTDKLIT